MESLNKIPNPFEKKPEGKINKEESHEKEIEVLEGAEDFGVDSLDGKTPEEHKKELRDEIEKFNKNEKTDKIRKSLGI